MEDLKNLLGEELFNKIQEKLGDKKVMVDDNFIPKTRFDQVNQEKNNLKKQLDELDPAALEEQKKQLWQTQKELLLQKEGLNDFKDFFNAEDSEVLTEKINAFKGILGETLKENNLNANYQPNQHKPTDAYAEASKKGDIGGMVGLKLQKIFR